MQHLDRKRKEERVPCPVQPILAYGGEKSASVTCFVLAEGTHQTEWLDTFLNQDPDPADAALSALLFTRCGIRALETSLLVHQAADSHDVSHI